MPFGTRNRIMNLPGVAVLYMYRHDYDDYVWLNDAMRCCGMKWDEVGWYMGWNGMMVMMIILMMMMMMLIDDA